MPLDLPGRSDAPSGFSGAGQMVIYCAMLVVIIAGLRAAAAIVVPFLLAVFVSIICWPLLDVLQRRLPFAAAISLVMLLLIGLALGVPLWIGGSIQQVLSGLPEFQSRLLYLETTLIEQLGRFEVDVTSHELLGTLDVSWGTAQLRRFLNGLMRAAGDAVLILVMIGFMLTEATWFLMKPERIGYGPDGQTERLQDVILNARRYIGIKTIVSIATGLVVWIGLVTLGVEHAAMWAFIAFMLNYVPTIGSILAGIAPAMFALVQSGIGVAVCVAALFLAVNQLFGSIIEPRLQGHGLGLSPLIVFVSLIFWGWVFGPIGMLLSAPLTMVIRIVCEAYPETHWIAVMLGGKPELVPECTS